MPLTGSSFPYYTNLPREGSVNCKEVFISGNGSEIINLYYTGSPQIYVEFESVTASLYRALICIDLDLEESLASANCVNQYYTANIYATTASNSDCIGNANGVPGTTSQTYKIYRPAATGCALNVVVTNINNEDNSGLAQPTSLYKAQERIWVGDLFPPDITDVLPGPVKIVDMDVTFIAGYEVINASCQSGGTECVTLTGNVTQIVSRNHCFEECIAPLEVCSRPRFGCFGEKIEVQLEGGIGPFMVNAYVNNQFAGSVPNVMSSTSINIHSAISNYNGNAVYRIEVIDAAGQLHVFSNNPLIGTNRFYQPIEDNMTQSELGNMVYARLGEITNDYPALFYDQVNGEPPYYGITSYELEVYNRWGELVYLTEDYLGGGQWSFDNGQIFWDGYGGLGGGCQNALQYNPVRFKARNCYSAHVYQDCFIDIYNFENPPSNFDPNEPCWSGMSPIEYLQNIFGTGYASNGGGILTGVGGCYEGDMPWEGILAGGLYTYPNNVGVVYRSAGNYGNSWNCEKKDGRELVNDSISNIKTQNNSKKQLNQEIIEQKINIVIYPNPTENILFLSGDLSFIENSKLINLQGQIVNNVTVENNSISLSNIEAGTYLLVIDLINGSKKSFRVIKM
jgi:hypothetical protein